MNLNQNYWFAPFRFQDYFLTKIMAFKYFHTLENQYPVQLTHNKYEIPFNLSPAKN